MLLKEKIENTMRLYQQHTIVTFLTSVKINEEDNYQPPQISTLIVSNKTPSIVAKIKCFIIEDYIEYEQEMGEKFKLKVFLKVHKVLATLLITLCKNFYIYANDPHICLLSTEDFKQLLKHKRFHVFSEDEVIRALSLWVRGEGG